MPIGIHEVNNMDLTFEQTLIIVVVGILLWRTAPVIVAGVITLGTLLFGAVATIFGLIMIACLSFYDEMQMKRRRKRR